MRRVILEHPWGKFPTDRGIDRLKYLALCIRDCLRKGDSPICSVPIYVLTNALDDADPLERRQGIEARLEFYKAVEACVVYRDFGISAKMQDGIDRARSMGLPIEERWIYGKPQRVEPRAKERADY